MSFLMVGRLTDICYYFNREPENVLEILWGNMASTMSNTREQNMMKLLSIFALVSLFFVAAGCTQKQDVKKIRLEKKEAPESHERPGVRPMRAAVGGMLTPKEGFTYYRDFLYYLEKKSGRPIEFVDKKSYAEINNLLETGDLDFAFVCSGPYVEGHDKFGLQLLVAPEVNGKSVYYSLIIVNSDSPVRSFGELKGRTFAFTDPLSNTGTLVPTYMLAKIKETPASFFKEHIYTNKHDISIKMVSDKLVDGAAVDSLVWEYMNKKRPDITSRTRIVEKSPPYGIPPVVVGKSVDPETKKILSDLFLRAHNDEEGRKILKGMMIDRFVPVSDQAYDSVREMITWTEKKKK